MTVTISVPRAELASGVPEGTEVIEWDGSDPRPEGADRIELFVGPYASEAPRAEQLAALPGLRAVQILSAGYEAWLPLIPDGVDLYNGRGVHGASTAELAVAGILAVIRQIPAFVHAQAGHRWDEIVTGEVAGRRAVVVGAGDIGARIARALDALDVRVTLVARTARDGVRALDELPALLPDHDIVVLALPHSPDTHHLVDARFLAALPDGAVLANIARGGIVDTEALLAELGARRLWAFLDVVDPEPLPPDHPLWDAPNLLLTPHVGGGTEGWVRRGAELVAAQVRRFAAGEPLINQVKGLSA